MEILGPEILRIATNLSVLLALLSAALLAVIVTVRLRAENRARRTSRYRLRVEPMVTAFVTGRSQAGDIVPDLRRDPVEALSLLMDVSANLEPRDRPRLQPLFASLELGDTLREELKTANWETRLPAAERLGYLGDKTAADELVRALQDEVLVVRLAAARSLVTLRAAAAVGPILQAFDVPGEMNERRTAEIIHEMGEDASAPLLAVLQAPREKYSDSVLNVASRVLGMLRTPSAAPALVALLEHGDFRVRLNAARALGSTGDRSVLPAVAKLTNDPAWQTRNAAVQSIGKLHGTGEIDRLVAALADSAWWVRFSAAQALFSLGPSGIDALKKAARDASDRYARDMSLQVLEEHGASPTGHTP